MQKFFRRYADYCYRPDSFRPLLENNTSPWWFLYWVFVLNTAVALVTFAFFFVSFLPKMQPFFAQLQQEIATIYPSDLVVTIKDGTLTTNQKEPYSVPLPKRWNDAVTKPGDPAIMLAAFDSSADVTSYEQYHAVLLFTKNAVAFPRRSSDGAKSLEVGFRSYQDWPNRTITKNDADAIVAAVSPWIAALPAFIVTTGTLLLTIGPFVIGAFRLGNFVIYLLIATWLVVLIARQMKCTATYWPLFRLTAFGSILPITAVTLLNMLGTKLPTFGFTLFLLIWMGVIVKKIAPTIDEKPKWKVS
jgi:hypothetical protein